MRKQVVVRVRRLADDSKQDMPYKSFNFIKDDIDDVTHQLKFELIGEVDEAGNLVPGNPNLFPQHRTEVPAQSVSPVAKTGEQTETTEAPKVAEVVTPVQVRKKPGRPAQVKLQETQA